MNLFSDCFTKTPFLNDLKPGYASFITSFNVKYTTTLVGDNMCNNIYLMIIVVPSERNV